MIRIEDRASRFGPIAIFQRRKTGAMIYDQFGSCQSEADRNGVSLASYVHAIYGLVLQTAAHNVLMIGCGGGTLGTMLTRAGRRVSIVDVNPDAFALARQYFGLPREIVCHVADGREFLSTETGQYDAIVLDAYHGDHLPAHLRSLDFFQSVRSRLRPYGSLFANIYVKNDQDNIADEVAQRMADVWSGIRVLDSRGWSYRNAIAMAGNVSKLQPPILRAPPLELAEEISRELETMQFRSWRDR